MHRGLLPFLVLLLFLWPGPSSNTSTRVTRDGINSQDVGVNIEWLTDEQLSELSEVEGQQARMEKLRLFFDAMEPGESKKTASEKIVADCYDWVKEAAGPEGWEELKGLHHSDHGKCKEKVAQLLGQLGAEEKAQVEAKLPFCEHVWYSQHHQHHGNAEEGQAEGATEGEEEQHQQHHHHHHRRWAHRHPRDHFDEDDGEHVHEKLESFLQSHLSWLTDEQKNELRAMEGQGREALRAKAMEFFESSTGEQRVQAIRQLKSGCRELLTRVFGPEKAAELREMKEAGASMNELEEKFTKMTEALEDEGKRAKVLENKEVCRKIFAMAAAGRRRRNYHEGHHEQHHGNHSVEDYLKTHLAWLDEAQKQEMKDLKQQGKPRAEIQEKVMAWYEAAQGETKTRATKLMQGGCRELLKMVLGEEKATKLKEMRESGTEMAKIMEQIEQWIKAVGDEKKKALAEQYKPVCVKVFQAIAPLPPLGEEKLAFQAGKTGRRRREGAEQLKELLDSHLAWLTEAQKEELRSMKGAGKGREEMREKVMGWYEQLEGEPREQAKESMQGGCRALMREVLGEENALKLKEMRESGASPENIDKEVDRMLGQVQDETKKAKATEYAPSCKKLFGIGASSRRRRDHHLEGHEAHHGGHTLDDYFKTHLSWLNDTQKEELKRLKGEGKTRAEMQQTVMDWLAQMEQGEERAKAEELLKGGCRELIKALLGEEKANEVKKMKEAGTDEEKIGQKLEQWIGQLEEGRKKQMALEYTPTCRKLFGLNQTAAADSSPAEVGAQTTAATPVAAAPAAEEGTTVTPEEAKSRLRRSRHRHGQSYGEYGQMQRQRFRGEEEVRLEEGSEGEEGEEESEEADSGDHHLDRHRTWLSGKQRKMLKGMRQRGHASHELHDKIHQFYEVSPDEVKATAKGILQKGCEAILQKIFGDYKAEEIIQAKEEGLSNAEIDEKVDEALAQIRNPQKREEAARFAMSCRRIFTMIERRRREVASSEKSLEELFKSHLSWLTDGQKEELRGLKESGKGRSELQQKVMDWFGQLEGEERGKALDKLRDGCRELLVTVLGKENADELKRMKEAGTGEAELEAKAQQLIGAIGDEAKKAKAKQFGPTCKQIFMAN